RLQSHRSGIDAWTTHRRRRHRRHGLQRWRRGRLPVGRRLARHLGGVERQPCTPFAAERFELLLEVGAIGVPPNRANDELHPVALWVLEVAVLVEDTDNRLRHLEHLLHGKEFVENVAAHWQNRRAAGDRNLPTLASVDDPRAPPDVVDRGDRVILAASFEGNLELAWQHAAQWMPQ